MALTGKTVSEGYGMTEFGLAALNPPMGVDKLGSIGLPSPGFVFSIRDDDGHELPQGHGGTPLGRDPDPMRRLLERRSGDRRGHLTRAGSIPAMR